MGKRMAASEAKDSANPGPTKRVRFQSKLSDLFRNKNERDPAREQTSDLGEGRRGLKSQSALLGAPSDQPETPAPVGDACVEPFFEEQAAGWCGKHALNNLLGGPFVDEDACRAAFFILCDRQSNKQVRHNE